MTKKDAIAARPIRRINLSLPIVQTDGYEIYDRTSTPTRPMPYEQGKILSKPQMEILKKHISSKTQKYHDARLSKFTGPALINLIVDMPKIPAESSLAMVDTISQALINSGYSESTIRSVPKLSKFQKINSPKSSLTRSRTSSDHRLFTDSVWSFEDSHNYTKPKNSIAITPAVKFFDRRRMVNRPLDSHVQSLKPLSISSYNNRAKELRNISNEHLQARIERLTRMHYPTIQQLRHGYPCPELLSNRIHLHREERRDFLPVLPRGRILPTIGQ